MTGSREATDYRIGIAARDKQRRHVAEALAQHVHAQYISYDDDADTDILRFHQRHDAPWSIVLDADALPVPDIRAQLHSALLHAPSNIVSLYLGTPQQPQWRRHVRDALHTANEKHANWILSTHLLHNTAYCIRRELLDSLLDTLPPSHSHATKTPGTHSPPHPVSCAPIEQTITQLAATLCETIAYTFPSLVDHTDSIRWPPTHTQHNTRSGPHITHIVGQPAHWNTTAIGMATAIPGPDHPYRPPRSSAAPANHATKDGAKS